MNEKDMVNDILSIIKTSMCDYTKAIGECSDQNLRQTLQLLRNEAEQFHFQLSQIATQKGYYKPAQQASQQDIQQVKSEFQVWATS